MDEGTRTNGTPALTIAAGDPVRIRAQIEETRAQLGDTVAALAIKADVKAQARSRVATVKARLAHKRASVMGRARETSPDAVSRATQSAAERARAHPLPLIVAGAIVAGFLVGRMTGR